MQPELIEIKQAAGEYVLTTDVVVSHRIPSFQTLEVGAYSTVIVPFSQTVQIVELQDGRNDMLSVYDLDNDTGVFDPTDPYRDRKIFEKVFSKTGLEGPLQALPEV